MLYLLLPLFERVLAAVLGADEFREWLEEIEGPGTVSALERIRSHAFDWCKKKGW